MPKPNILLVEDDAEISRLTSLYLEAEGFSVTIIDDGALAVDAVKTTQPAMVILDLMLPNMSGIEICKAVRNFYQRPILILTACDDDISEVSLLKLGADDYLVKPLRPHVLVARIEALLRRHTPTLSTTEQLFIVNHNSDSVTYRGQNLELTKAEFEMLKMLIANIGDVVSREQCCQALRGIDYDFSNRSIDMRISGLRKKLGDTQMPYKVILTIRNQGYKLING